MHAVSCQPAEPPAPLTGELMAGPDGEGCGGLLTGQLSLEAPLDNAAAVAWDARVASTWLDQSGAFVLALDPQGQIQHLSANGCKALGKSPAELVGTMWGSYVVPTPGYCAVSELLARALRDELDAAEPTRWGVRNQDGCALATTWRHVPWRDASGHIIGMLSYGELCPRQAPGGATERVPDRAQPSEGLQVGSLPVGICRLSLDPVGQLLQANRDLATTLGEWNEQDLRGHCLGEYCVDPAQAAVILEETQALGEVRGRELRLRRGDAREMWASISARLGQGTAPDARWIDVVIEDITERKTREERMREQALVDPLTALYNRRGLAAIAPQQVALATRHGKSILVLFVDLDGLKAINDQHGHEMGDQALADTANVLRATFRQADVLARVGGDEFVILAIGAAQEHASTMVARLARCVAESNATGHRPYALSLSVGAAECAPTEPGGLERAVMAADRLMYEQKRTRT